MSTDSITVDDDTLRVNVNDGKYTVILDKKGGLRALRYGEEWRDCCGDGLILSFAQEVDHLRKALSAAITKIRNYEKLVRAL